MLGPTPSRPRRHPPTPDPQPRVARESQDMGAVGAVGAGAGLGARGHPVERVEVRVDELGEDVRERFPNGFHEVIK